MGKRYRKQRKFLWFPMDIFGKTRWFKRATWVEERRYFVRWDEKTNTNYNGYHWVPLVWLEDTNLYWNEK